MELRGDRDLSAPPQRDALGVSDSVLSKHLKVLEDTDYLKDKRTAIDARVRTRARLTKAGRRAFAAHIAELRRIAAMAPGLQVASESLAATGDD